MTTAGPVQARRARQTGRLVEVWRAEDMAIDAGDDTWISTCVDHSTLVTHRTRQLACWHAVDPLTWCEPCQIDADPALRSCGTCGGACRWERHETGTWSCETCGADWTADAGEQYATP